jgi:hypothetical protein
MAKRRKKGPSWDELHPPRPHLIKRLQWEGQYISDRLKEPKPPKDFIGSNGADEFKLREAWRRYDLAKEKYEVKVKTLSLAAIRASAKAIDEGLIR